MDLRWKLCLLLGFAGHICAFSMVAAPKGTCASKKAYGILATTKKDCDTMGGTVGENANEENWVNCHFDWCSMPVSGRVASGHIWSIDPNQDKKETTDSRTYCFFEIQRKGCDVIYGRYNGNPGANEWVNCHVYMKRMNGNDRNKIQSLVFRGEEECEDKLALGIIGMQNRDCLKVGGTWNGNPGANDWTECHLEICRSPSLKCHPKDEWNTIQVCKNPSSSKVQCSYSLETGIENGASHKTENAGSKSVTVSAEVGAELKSIFSAKLSLSHTTSFEWSKAVEKEELWRESTTKYFSVDLEPGKSVAIEQVVGICGSYNVRTPTFKVEDV